MKKIHSKVLGAVLIASLLGAVCVAGAASADPANPVQEQSHVNPQFSVLEEAASPSSAFESIGDPLTAGVEGSAEVVAAATGETIEVASVENAEEACITNSRIVTCGELEQAASGRLMALASCAPGMGDNEVEIVGLVPDGVSSVTVSVAGSASATIPVTENVVSATVDGLPTAVSWSDENGNTEAAPLPSDPALLQC